MRVVNDRLFPGFYREAKNIEVGTGFGSPISRILTVPFRSDWSSMASSPSEASRTVSITGSEDFNDFVRPS